MPEKKQRNGLLQIYTGSSEHLDYAPVGLALRAAGQNLKTHLTCLIPFPLSEVLPRAAALLSPHLTLAQTTLKENDPRKWSKQDRQDMRDAFQGSRNALLSGKFFTACAMDEIGSDDAPSHSQAEKSADTSRHPCHALLPWACRYVPPCVPPS